MRMYRTGAEERSKITRIVSDEEESNIENPHSSKAMLKADFRTVHPEFREAMEKHFPGLNKNHRYWYLLDYIIFHSPRREDALEYMIADRKTICALEGKDYDPSHYSAITFLEAFTLDVIPLKISDYNSTINLARRIYRPDWPTNVKTLIDNELKHPCKQFEGVKFASGTKITRRHVTEFRVWNRDEAINQMVNEGCDDAYNLLKYLNNQDGNRFTKLHNNMQAACDYANALEEPSRTRQLLNLAEIRLQAQPFYKASSKGRTVRAFTIGQSILSVKTEIRHILCAEWIELDLQSCHLAICGSEWKIPEVQVFLLSGESIWSSLAECLNLVLTPEIKDILKIYMYSIVYGDGADKLKDLIDDSRLFKPGDHLKLKNHKVIKPLLKKRTTIMQKIAGEAVRCACDGEYQVTKDIYGRAIECPWINDKPNPRSVLASCMQSIELWLLAGCIDLVKDSDDCAITLWQHDGFSFKCKHNKDSETWIKKFQSSVKERADSRGIITSLVGK